MHELSVCYAMLDEVERIALEKSASRVTRIVVKIGPLSGIESDLLRRAYPLAAAGTIAQRAELEIERADIIVQCSECGVESHVPPNRLLCAVCGGFQTRIISGDEMILQRVELADLVQSSNPAADPDRLSASGNLDSR